MKDPKPSVTQRERARREFLAAIDIFRQLGMTKEQVEAMAGSMYDFQVEWAEKAGTTPKVTVT